MRYLLDTNICIYLARRQPPALRARLERIHAGDAGISVITLGELHFGVAGSQHPERSNAVLQELTATLPVVEMSAGAAEHYGQIRWHLERKGRPIGGNDLWIAAHARSLDLTIVTNNSREFQRVPGLRVENWVTSANA
jgi:tRNA(fMet)-specific endonuclease VapC